MLGIVHAVELGIELLSIQAITMLLYIPHFVGKVQLCVKFLQRERMDVGMVQEQVVANVI